MDALKTKTMCSSRFVRLLLSCFFLMGIMESGAFAGEQTLQVKGTGDSQLILQMVGKTFEEKYPEMKIVVPSSIGSNGGIRALLAGEADLARTGRPLDDKEKAEGLREIMFCRSPVVFAVHPSVTGVTDLSSADVIKIFTGNITNWKSVGGPDHKIYPVDRETDDSSRKIMIAAMPGFPPLPAFKVFYSVPEVLDAMAVNPYTISFLPYPMVYGQKLITVRLDGVGPADSAYPYLCPQYIVYKGTLAGSAKDFVDFLFADDTRALIRQLGGQPVDRTE